jgi:NADH-quinone oxidoreductase subunit J
MVVSGLFVVFSRSPINSVLSLILCFIAMAGHYILLNSQFLAVVHLIVYTGAIMVLFLNKATIPQKTSVTRVAAVVAGGLFFLVMVAATRQTFEIHPRYPFSSQIGLVSEVGKALFNEFLLPFEVSSVLFISAMIGAMIFGKKDKTTN